MLYAALKLLMQDTALACAIAYSATLYVDDCTARLEHNGKPCSARTPGAGRSTTFKVCFASAQ